MVISRCKRAGGRLARSTCHSILGRCRRRPVTTVLDSALPITTLGLIQTGHKIMKVSTGRRLGVRPPSLGETRSQAFCSAYPTARADNWGMQVFPFVPVSLVCLHKTLGGLARS